MSRWMRFTSGLTAFAMLFTTLAGTVYTQEQPAKKPEAVRTIVARDAGSGWAVVDVRTVHGKVVVLSPVVGREIDLDESIKYSMFQGPSEFNRRALIPALAASVPGFTEAVFMERPGGRHAVKISFTAADRTLHRTIPLKGNDLKRIREYVENFDAVQSGDYKIHKSKTKIPDDAEYPKVTDEDVSYETRVPRFVLSGRLDGQVVLTDGDEISGEFVPVFDEGSILIESDFTSHRVPVENIDRIRTSGNKSSSAMRGAVRTMLGSALSGALTGALAAWQQNADVKEWMVFGTVFFGAAGFLTGLATGIGRGRASEDIVLGPIEQKSDED